MTVEKPIPKELLRPLTTGANSAINQSELQSITCNLIKAREKSCAQGTGGFGFASHWSKNWRAIFKPITKRSNRVINLDRHLKTTLSALSALYASPAAVTAAFCKPSLHFTRQSGEKIHL